MVDFQSRDTRRGLADDAGEPEDDVPDDSPAEGERDRTGVAADHERTEGNEHGAEVVAVIATSGTGTDVSDAAADTLEAQGYDVRGRDRRARDHDAIQGAVDEFIDRTDVCAVVTVGGTGVSPVERTVEAVRPLFTKELPGFGEAFRREWAAETGDGGLASRVTGGLADDTPVFCLPGDAEAATFGARELVAPQAAGIHRDAAGI